MTFSFFELNLQIFYVYCMQLQSLLNFFNWGKSDFVKAFTFNKLFLLKLSSYKKGAFMKLID